LRRPRHSPGRAVAPVARRPAPRARHRRAQPVPPAGRARPRRRPLGRAAPGARHPLRSLRRPRARRAPPRAILGRAPRRAGGAVERRAVLEGGYRLVDRGRPDITLWATGVMVPEAVEAGGLLEADGIRANVFAITSPDLLYRGYVAARKGGEATSYLETLVR